MDEHQQLLNVLDSIETAFDGDEWSSVEEEAPEAVAATEGREPSSAEAVTSEEPAVDAPTPAAPEPVVGLPAVDVEAARRPRREVPPPIACTPRVRQSTRTFLEHFHRVATP